MSLNVCVHSYDGFCTFAFESAYDPSHSTSSGSVEWKYEFATRKSVASRWLVNTLLNGWKSSTYSVPPGFMYSAAIFAHRFKSGSQHSTPYDVNTISNEPRAMFGRSYTSAHRNFASMPVSFASFFASAMDFSEKSTPV